MKQTLLAIFAAAALVGCNKEKAAIEDNKDMTKEVINDQKDAVDASAKAAKKQTDVNAEIDKAKIEAKKDRLTFEQ